MIYCDKSFIILFPQHVMFSRLVFALCFIFSLNLITYTSLAVHDTYIYSDQGSVTSSQVSHDEHTRLSQLEASFHSALVILSLAMRALQSLIQTERIFVIAEMNSIVPSCTKRNRWKNVISDEQLRNLIPFTFYYSQNSRQILVVNHVKWNIVNQCHFDI